MKKLSSREKPVADADVERLALEVEAALCVVHWVGSSAGSACGVWRWGDGGAVYDRSLVTCSACANILQWDQAIADGDIAR